MTGGGLSAIKSFEKLKLKINHNAPEGGQTYRTLAHVLKRLIIVQYLSRDKIVKALPGEHHSLRNLNIDRYEKYNLSYHLN